MKLHFGVLGHPLKRIYIPLLRVRPLLHQAKRSAPPAAPPFAAHRGSAPELSLFAMSAPITLGSTASPLMGGALRPVNRGTPKPRHARSMPRVVSEYLKSARIQNCQNAVCGVNWLLVERNALS
jgi:hypothetical protein